MREQGAPQSTSYCFSPFCVHYCLPLPGGVSVPDDSACPRLPMGGSNMKKDRESDQPPSSALRPGHTFRFATITWSFVASSRVELRLVESRPTYRHYISLDCALHTRKGQFRHQLGPGFVTQEHHEGRVPICTG